MDLGVEPSSSIFPPSTALPFPLFPLFCPHSTVCISSPHLSFTRIEVDLVAAHRYVDARPKMDSHVEGNRVPPRTKHIKDHTHPPPPPQRSPFPFRDLQSTDYIPFFNGSLRQTDPTNLLSAWTIDSTFFASDCFDKIGSQRWFLHVHVFLPTRT